MESTGKNWEDLTVVRSVELLGDLLENRSARKRAEKSVETRVGRLAEMREVR